MGYRLALLTLIPLIREADAYLTLDLWARDLQGQVSADVQVLLFAPVVDELPPGWTEPLPVPNCVRVVDTQSTFDGELSELLAGCDVLQVPGNAGWRASRPARRFMALARRLKKPVVVGISSNRARTELLNSERQSMKRRMRGYIRYASIRCTQAYLASRSSGVFVVGEGLRHLVSPWNKNVFVGTASWIRRSDIAPRRISDLPGQIRICVASRLERMKGVHLAIEALAILSRRDSPAAYSLKVAGTGPERAGLQALVEQKQLERVVQFVGTFAYPQPFFSLLQNVEVVLLTNLNDEQPRLVFDAISQGCIPVCPDSLPYRSLGVPDSLLYRRGDPCSLAEVVQRLKEATHELPALLSRLESIAEERTLESMHSLRSRWVRETVLN